MSSTGTGLQPTTGYLMLEIDHLRKSLSIAEQELAASEAAMQTLADQAQALDMGYGQGGNYRESLHIAKARIVELETLVERINGRAQVTYAMQNDNVRALLDIRLMCEEMLNRQDGVMTEGPSLPAIAKKFIALTAERDRYKAALEKLRSYNVYTAGGLNYRPEDHITVIDLALFPTKKRVRR